VTTYESINNVLRRLDDYPALSGESVWTRAEVELYLSDGFNAFTRQTKCLFDMEYPENLPTCGNYVAAWELGYFASGYIKQDLLNFTGGYWEKDYAFAGAFGPANHNQPWEAAYLTTTFAVSSHPVPDDLVAIDRATYNWHKLSPEFTRFFEQRDRDFQETGGEPWRFSMDRDGIARLRIVPAGSGQATTYTTSGSFGLLRQASGSEFGSSSPVGTWGALREIPVEFPQNTPYGIPRRLYSDTANTRLEFFRLGRSLDELPSRFVKYLEFYACAKCLERDGPGQDLKLAAHFMDRFGEGVGRMVRRIGENRKAVSHKIGSVGRVPTHPPTARLPWRYGRQIRRGY
jgi:hypothetical protein